jgi:hypothetical protein
MHASLVAASACDCPDGSVETTAFASWKNHQAAIDACIADDQACEALCRAVLKASVMDVVAIPKCIITGTDRSGVSLAIEYLQPVDCGVGRRPAGYKPPVRKRGVGAWLASAATLEAASVTSFARLARVLVQLEAPRKLVEAVMRALGDELVHARLVGMLARAHGATVEAPVVEPRDEEGLVDLAIENAAEGQIGETFGALVAACQARSAADRAVREIFGRIALDEARHAALAHHLAPFFERRLGLLARNAVARARQEAVVRVLAACDFGLAPAEREELGLPAPDQLRSATRQLFASVH